MEQNTPKFRLRLNLFDTIVLVLALAVGAFLLWRAVKPAAPVQADPTATSTIRYTVRFQRWIPGTSEIIQPGDRIADNIKNYEVGHVVSAQAVPALVQTPDRESRRWVWAELEGFEDVLVTVEAPCQRQGLYRGRRLRGPGGHHRLPPGRGLYGQRPHRGR